MTYIENYTAADVLAEIAWSFVGTDHEDWMRFDSYEGELQLGNLRVVADGDKLTWRDLGLPRIAGSVEIPVGVGVGWDEELPGGSYIGDVIDEVSTWLLGWTEDIDIDWLLEELHDEVGGELTENVHGGRVVVAADGVTVWSVTAWDVSPWVMLTKGSVTEELDDGSVGVVWEDSRPVDPDLVVTGYEWEALTEALKEMR